MDAYVSVPDCPALQDELHNDDWMRCTRVAEFSRLYGACVNHARAILETPYAHASSLICTSAHVCQCAPQASSV